jgi:hypothetical protein
MLIMKQFKNKQCELTIALTTENLDHSNAKIFSMTSVIHHEALKEWVIPETQQLS